VVPLRRRAIWIAAAVSILVLSVGGALASGGPSFGPDSGPTSVHQVVADHDAVVSSRAAVERTSLDLRQVHSKALLLAWLGVLLGAALLARTAGRTIEVRTRRSGSAVATQPCSDRGPPRVSFA
jgi:hypothetical protein